MELAKQLIMLGAMITCFYTCASGKKINEPISEDLAQWRSCPKELKQPIGFVCSRFCSKKHLFGSCKEWGERIRNFNNPADYEYFRSGNYIIIRESQI